MEENKLHDILHDNNAVRNKLFILKISLDTGMMCYNDFSMLSYSFPPPYCAVTEWCALLNNQDNWYREAGGPGMPGGGGSLDYVAVHTRDQENA